MSASRRVEVPPRVARGRGHFLARVHVRVVSRVFSPTVLSFSSGGGIRPSRRPRRFAFTLHLDLATLGTSPMAPPRALARALARGLPSRAGVAPSRALPLAFTPARHKATQATARVAPPPDLPFYASWIGGFLGASLSREQLDAFAAAFLPSHHAARIAATTPGTTPASTPDASAALAAAKRERDAAASRVSALEADALALRLRLAQTDAAALESLRAEAADARAEAADARIALNAARDRADVATAALATAKSDALDEVRAATLAEFDATRVSLEANARDALHAAVARAEAAERALAAREASAKASSDAATHPTFGRLLHDFGYKRVFATPAGNLASKDKVMVYDQQRAFREERAALIAAEKAKAPAFSIPGIISIAEGTAAIRGGRRKTGVDDAPRPTVSILDGQHRVGAIDILIREGRLRPDDPVLVEVFPNVDDDEAAALFREINSAQPVRLVDMPGETTPEAKWALEGAAQRLKARYPAMFSASTRCKAPNVHIDQLREEMHEARVMERFALASEEATLAWLDAVNDRLAERDDDAWLAARPKRGKGSGGTRATYLKALAKAREHGFYLGMDFNWLDPTDDEVNESE